MSNELVLEDIFDILRKEDLELKNDSKIFIEGGLSYRVENKLTDKNKICSLLQKLSNFRVQLNYLIGLKKNELLERKYNFNSFNFDDKKKTKEEKDSELIATDSSYRDLNELILKYENILKYFDDLYYIIYSMEKNCI